MNIDELEARIAEAKERIREIDSLATQEGRDLKDDETEEWNRLNEQIEADKQSLEERHARLNRLAELDEKPEHRDAPHFETRKPDTVRGEDIWDLSTIRMSVGGPQEAKRQLQDRAKYAVEGMHFPHPSSNREDSQGHLERLIEDKDGEDGKFSRYLLEVASPEYRRAFGKALLGGPAEERVLGIKEGKLGNYAVPITLDPTVLPIYNGVVNPIRTIARVEQMTGNTWKGVTSKEVTATYKKEAEKAEDKSAELGQPEAVVRKAHTFMPYSVEVEQDWGALEREMAVLIADAKDKLEAEEFLAGTGEDPAPEGIEKGATELVETATEKTFAIADVFSLEAALPPKYRPNADIIANRGIYNKVRQFDTAGGAGLWLTIGEALGNNIGNAGQLLGYPAYELSTMESAVTKEKTIMFIGDFGRYFLIAERLGMTVEIIPHIITESVPTGQRGLYAYWRNTSKVLHKVAFRGLKVK